MLWGVRFLGRAQAVPLPALAQRLSGLVGMLGLAGLLLAAGWRARAAG